VRCAGGLIMKRFIAAISLAVLTGSALAAHEAPDRLMNPPSAGASLPDLGSTDAARMLEEMQRSPLSGERAPLFGERPRYLGPRPYWENDPLFSAPLR
jgi:hypothetical protein